MKDPVARAGLMVVSLFAAGWLFRLTEKGIGIGSDSVVYIAGARNLVGGEGFVWKGGDQLPRPINHYPPLYSVTLVPGLALQLSAEDTARSLNAIVTGINTYLVGFLVGLLSSSGPAAVLGAVVFAVSEETILLHSWAMSDSLYLVFALLVVILVVRAQLFKDHGEDLALASVVAGLGFLTRYVGLSLFVVPVAGLYIQWSTRSRLRMAAAGLLTGIVPGLLWLGRNYYLTGSTTNRRLGVIAQDAGWWTEIGRILESWLLPGRVLHNLAALRVPPGSILVLGLLAGVLVLWWNYRQRDPLDLQPLFPVWGPLIVLMLAHLGAVLASAWLTYPGPDLTARNLAPMIVALCVLFSACIGIGWSRGSLTTRTVATVLAISFVGFKAYASRDTVQRLLRDGQGYTAAAWSRSPTVLALQSLDPAFIYANDVGAVYYFTGKHAYEIPKRYDPVNGAERGDYRREYCEMRLRLRESVGALVYFDLASSLPETAAREDVVDGMRLLVQAPDGDIFVDGGGEPAMCLPGGVSEGPAEFTQRIRTAVEQSRGQAVGEAVKASRIR